MFLTNQNLVDDCMFRDSASEHELREERIGVGHRLDIGVRNGLVRCVTRSQFVETILSGIRLKRDERPFVSLT